MKYLLLLLLSSTLFAIEGRFSYEDGSFLQPTDVLTMWTEGGLSVIGEISDVWSSHYVIDGDYEFGSYFTAYDYSRNLLMPVEVSYSCGDRVDLMVMPEPLTVGLLGMGVILIPKFSRRTKTRQASMLDK